MQISNRGILGLVWKIPFGRGGSSNNTSALVRPFRRTLQESKLPGRVAYVFHQDSGRYNIFGSFVHSTSGKIFFYPGTMGGITTTSLGANRQTQQLIHVDHFTLEGDLSKWHFTLSERETDGIRFPSQRTAPWSSEIVLWFVLQFKKTALEPCPEILKLRLSQGKGRIEIARFLSSAVESGPVIQLDNNITDFFWQVEAFVSQCGDCSLERIPPIVIPTPGAEISSQQPTDSQIACIQFDGSSKRICLRTSKIIGTLSEDVYFIPVHNDFFEKAEYTCFRNLTTGHT